MGPTGRLLFEIDAGELSFLVREEPPAYSQRDPVQPALEGVWVAKSRHAAPRRHESLLYDIFREGGVEYDAAAYRLYSPFVPAKQDIERGA